MRQYETDEREREGWEIVIEGGSEKLSVFNETEEKGRDWGRK